MKNREELQQMNVDDLIELVIDLQNENKTLNSKINYEKHLRTVLETKVDCAITLLKDVI